MAKFKEIYRCEVCGNIAEILHGGAGHPVCCNQPMTLLEPKTEDTGREKHVPVLEREGKTIKVKVGSVQHPMEDKHYIHWVDVSTPDRIYRVFLKPGQTPEAQFELEGEEVAVKEYCTIHGLWKIK